MVHCLSLSCCWLLCWQDYPQADLLLLSLLQEARARVRTGVTQHSMSGPLQEDPALSQIATTEVPQTAGIGSLPGICDVSDDIMDISSPAQSEQALVAASHAKQAGSMTTGLPPTARLLPTATGEFAEVSMQEEIGISVTTAKAPCMEDNAGEVLTAADSAFLNVADAGGKEASAAAMAECGSAYLTEAHMGEATEAPADPLAPHSIFASDGLTSRHLADSPAAAKAMHWPQVTPVGSPAAGGQVQGAIKDAQRSPTTPLELAGQSADSAGSSPTAAIPEGRQSAGFRSADRSGAHSTFMAAAPHNACTKHQGFCPITDQSC